MILLGVDTCDSRGSVALLRDSELLAVERHLNSEDYSSWLIPACSRVLGSRGLSLADAYGYAVASGPGSFTGLRVGLTTVKAWSEVFRKPVAAVSRLEAIASQTSSLEPLVAAFVDAQRGQLFGALYKRKAGALHRIQDEMVLPPADFVAWVQDHVATGRVAWASLDPEIVTTVEPWKRRIKEGDSVHLVSPVLAPVIARMGMAQFQAGQVTDALHLDANYLRRSDAEIFWKGAAKPASRA
jgi:tRNA threonylcarbamoyladenosine biosynthesis protein TsaB